MALWPQRVSGLGCRVVPPLAEDELHVAPCGSPDRHLDVMPGRSGSLDGGHRLSLWISPVCAVIAEAVRQVDPANVCDVRFGTVRVAEHRELLMM